MKTFYFQEPSVDGAKTFAAGDKYEADENDVQHLIELGVLGEKPPEGVTSSGDDQPDYERDDLGKLDLNKSSTSKAQLLVIAAYEKAEVPEGDAASKADLIKAIEAKRATA